MAYPIPVARQGVKIEYQDLRRPPTGQRLQQPHPGRLGVAEAGDDGDGGVGVSDGHWDAAVGGQHVEVAHICCNSAVENQVSSRFRLARRVRNAAPHNRV